MHIVIILLSLFFLSGCDPQPESNTSEAAEHHEGGEAAEHEEHEEGHEGHEGHAHKHPHKKPVVSAGNSRNR